MDAGLTEEQADSLIEMGLTEDRLKFLRVGQLTKLEVPEFVAYEVVGRLNPEAAAPPVASAPPAMPSEITVNLEKGPKEIHMMDSEELADVLADPKRPTKDKKRAAQRLANMDLCVVLNKVGGEYDPETTKRFWQLKGPGSSIVFYMGTMPVVSPLAITEDNEIVELDPWKRSVGEVAALDDGVDDDGADWSDVSVNLRALFLLARRRCEVCVSGITNSFQAIDVLVPEELPRAWQIFQGRIDPEEIADAVKELSKPLSEIKAQTQASDRPVPQRREPSTPESTMRRSGTSQEQLVELFRSLFSSADELQRFVRFGVTEGQSICGAVGWSQPLNMVVFRVVEQLRQRGLIREDLFDALEQQMPNRRNDIRYVGGLFNCSSKRGY